MTTEEPKLLIELRSINVGTDPGRLLGAGQVYARYLTDGVTVAVSIYNDGKYIADVIMIPGTPENLASVESQRSQVLTRAAASAADRERLRRLMSDRTVLSQAHHG